MAKQTEVEMVAGSRGPESSGRAPGLTSQGQEQREVRPTANFGKYPPGTVEYHSRFAITSKGFHTVQITSPADRIDLATGIRTVARPKKLVFKDGRAVCSDPEINERIKGNSAKGIPPHPNYGLGKDFWDAREALEAGVAKSIEDATKTLIDHVDAIRGDEERVKMVLERLGVEDYILAPRKPKDAEKPDQKKG